MAAEERLQAALVRGDGASSSELLSMELTPAGVRPQRVLASAPASVLIVDLATGHVIFADDRARDLAPGATLPLPLAEWAGQAGLPSPEGGTPLARVAAGQTVDGEPLLLGRGAGQASRPVWMTAFALGGSPALTGAALVVLLDLDAVPASAETVDPLRELRDRAVIATDISFTISDPALDDNPLVWVNPAFTRTTGYAAEDVVGRNCRVLQGPGTDPAAVAQIRAAITERRPQVVTLLNYRADGTSFWNELALSPVFDGQGDLTHFVGVQSDVSARIEVEQEREAAYAAEREARAEAEAARERLSLLAEATSLLAATLNVDAAMERLASVAVPLLADWAMVDITEGFDLGYHTVYRHVDSTGLELLRRVDEVRPRTLNPSSYAARVLSTGEPVLVSEIDEAELRSVSYDGEQFELFRQLQPRSLIVVPLRARRQSLGTFTLAVGAASGRRFGEPDLELARDLGRRAALALDNARLYTREHEVAEALQRSLLPEMPVLPGLALAARYLASSEGAQVGGDWYDVLALPDGAVGLAIGDVMGHDLTAAAAMGQLRSVLRSYAWEGDPAGLVLDRMDRLIQGLEMAQLATAIYARFEPCPGSGARMLRYANAGHLPPLLRDPDGKVRYLEDGQSVLLGASAERREEAAEQIEPGSTLVLFTDGLVERRGVPIDQGLAWLADAVEHIRPGAGPDAVCDAILGALEPDSLPDDIALLALRLER